MVRLLQQSDNRDSMKRSEHISLFILPTNLHYPNVCTRLLNNQLVRLEPQESYTES